ncbi:WcaI family glycosyltransferase [Runella salmonicolor]|uniref:WcaI family glycosyltransferase n=1 Tax=Runella salmonicolor TaxID=2950278 RepID=A0ABT1FRH5_9BACT|nr:WcaI family glycosyltransferase [Runella salmonicolor]MCP1384364.1 WcaI family glycosyltransferase [Runella salmonicolor]
MNILVYGLNFSPELTGSGKYTGEMATWFAENNFNVEVIAAVPHYPEWKLNSKFENKWSIEKKDNLIIKRCPIFIPKDITGYKRILHEFSFHLTSLWHWLPCFFKRYDVIISVAPPMLIGIYPTVYNFFWRKCIHVYHIQDLQVDVARELKLINSKILLSILYRAEKLILKNAGIISSISDGMKDKLLSKAIDKQKYFMLPNWVETDFIKPLAPNISMLQRYGLTINDFIVLYCGSIGEKQGLEIMIDAAKHLEGFQNIKFLICGNGVQKDALISYAESMELNNIIFANTLPYNELPDLLSIAHIHLVIQKAATSDLLMPSKLTTILSAGGVSIITANPGTTLYNLIHKHNLGICIEPGSALALSETILFTYNNYSIMENKKLNARNYALSFLDKENILNRLKKAIEK